MKSSKYFKDDDILVNGHELGYINDISQGKNPVNSVFDCLNMDFYNGYSQRRDPYSALYNLSAVIPSGYTLNKFFCKEYVDKSNEATSCTIAICTKTGERTRIFTNKYYNGGNNYGNGKNSTTGWITEWQEITEKHELTITGAIAASNGTSTIVAPKDIAVDYFRGFFIYDLYNDCTGFVTKSTAASSGASCTLTIRLNPYFNGTTIALRTILTATNYILVRFPVNTINDFEDITDISFAESYNSLRISCGEEHRTLWLGLLNDKNFFNQTSPIGTGDNRYYTAWYGFWFDFDSPNILNKKIYTNNYSTPGALTYTNHFNESDFLELGLILYHRILTNHLSNQSTAKAASILISLDGFQPLFLKNLLLDINASGHNASTSIWDSINVIWGLNFNRRVTDLHLFYNTDTYFKSIATSDENIINEIFPTYQMEPNSGGIINFTDKPRNCGEYDFTKNAYLTYLIQSFGTIPYEYDWSNVSGYNYANGMALYSYLNSYYYNDININCRKLLKVDNLILAAGLQNKLEQIALTNMVNGDVETESIYSPERLFKVTPGDDIITAERTQRSEFLLFTKTQAILCDIQDKAANVIAVRERFINQGTVSAKSVVAAKFRGELQGVFWCGNRGIYMFIDNQLIELTEGKWNNEYLEISDNDKGSIVAGYLPNKNDVYFVIGDTIYIYNLIFKHWKKYEYSDVPTYFQTDVSGELLFAIGSNLILKTEKKGTTEFKDLGSKTIEFFTNQLFNHGNGDSHKILNQIELMFDYDPDDTSTYTGLLITSGSNNDDDTDIYNGEILFNEDDGNKIISKIITKNKIRSNYYNIKISSATASDNIKTFKIFSILNKVKITGKKLFKV